MPSHQEMKRMQFARRFHNAQLAITSNDRMHTTGYGKHEFCAGEALQSHAEVRHSNTRSAFGADSRQLLVRDRLHTGIRRYNDVARRQVLPERQPVAKVAATRDGANPVLPIKSF